MILGQKIWSIAKSHDIIDVVNFEANAEHGFQFFLHFPMDSLQANKIAKLKTSACIMKTAKDGLVSSGCMGHMPGCWDTASSDYQGLYSTKGL